MTRSTEAIERRAAKRSLTVEEQLKHDSGKRQKKNASTESPNQTKTVQISQDWICSKCSNNNFAARKECNRCGENRPDGPVEQKREVRADKKVQATKVAKDDEKRIPPKEQKEGNWSCPKCSNSNFPSRGECNRCQTAKPDATPPTKLAIDTAKKSAPSSSISKPVRSKSASTSSSSSSSTSVRTAWPKQASAEEIARNQRLREVAAGLLSSSLDEKGTAVGDDTATTASHPSSDASATLTEAELARAKVLLERTQRKREKKDKMKKWKETKNKQKAKLSTKSAVAKPAATEPAIAEAAVAKATAKPAAVKPATVKPTTAKSATVKSAAAKSAAAKSAAVKSSDTQSSL